jgi:hypothetical protein
MRLTTASGRTRAAELGATIKDCRKRIRALLRDPQRSADLLTAVTEYNVAVRELHDLTNRHS